MPLADVTTTYGDFFLTIVKGFMYFEMMLSFILQYEWVLTGYYASYTVMSLVSFFVGKSQSKL